MPDLVSASDQRSWGELLIVDDGLRRQVHLCTPGNNDTSCPIGKKAELAKLASQPLSRDGSPVLAHHARASHGRRPARRRAAAVMARSAGFRPVPPTHPLGARRRQRSVDPLQAVKEASLRALAVARRGGPAEKAQPGASAVDRFLCALTEPDDEVAWPLFKQISLDAPKEPWGEIGMAHVYVRWHIRDQATQAFARALRIDPGNPIALVEQALADRAFGDLVDAATLDEQLAHPRSPTTHALLLLAWRLAEDGGAPKQELQADYQRAARCTPGRSLRGPAVDGRRRRAVGRQGRGDAQSGRGARADEPARSCGTLALKQRALRRANGLTRERRLR